MKSVRIRSFFGPYSSASALNTERYIPNMGKYGPENIRIRTLFTKYMFLSNARKFSFLAALLTRTCHSGKSYAIIEMCLRILIASAGNQ